MCAGKTAQHLGRLPSGGSAITSCRSHTMAKQFLADDSNDLVALANLLGHESLNTTSRYSQQSGEQLAEGVERLTY